MLLAAAALVVGGNARADVVGLSTTSNSIGSLIADDAVLHLNFRTTGLSGNRLTGISFADLGSEPKILSATLIKDNREGGVFFYSDLAYSTAGGIITFETGFGKIGSTILDANSDYELTINNDGTEILRASICTDSSVTNSIPDWIYSTSLVTYPPNGSAAFTLYTAVPEPGTLILTGTALVAGAVGAYLKRRRKNRAETDAPA